MFSTVFVEQKSYSKKKYSYKITHPEITTNLKKLEFRQKEENDKILRKQCGRKIFYFFVSKFYPSFIKITCPAGTTIGALRRHLPLFLPPGGLPLRAILFLYHLLKIIDKINFKIINDKKYRTGILNTYPAGRIPGSFSCKITEQKGCD